VSCDIGTSLPWVNSDKRESQQTHAGVVWDARAVPVALVMSSGQVAYLGDARDADRRRDSVGGEERSLRPHDADTRFPMSGSIRVMSGH
jgi:hypothetical protein